MPEVLQINTLSTFLREEIKTLSIPFYIFISTPIIVNVILEQIFPSEYHVSIGI